MNHVPVPWPFGKPHNDVMKAIRKMEPAWVKVCEGNFSLRSRMWCEGWCGRLVDWEVDKI